MFVFLLYDSDGEHHWYAAKDEADARLRFKEDWCETAEPADMPSIASVTQIPDEEVLEFTWEDEPDSVPEGAAPWSDKNPGIRATAKAWAAWAEQPMMLATSVC